MPPRGRAPSREPGANGAVTLRETISTPDGKRRYVRQLFATIADRYDFITRFLSFGQDRRWKRRLVALAQVTPDDRVLDVACGTGDILFEALRFTPRRAVGLDLTHRMLVIAAAAQIPPPDSGSRRAVSASDSRSRVAVSPRWIAGDILDLPLRDDEFSVVTTGYGLRNVPDLARAIGQMYRVLAPGGRLLSLDFNRPANPLVRGVYLAYLTVVGSTLGLALHGDADTYRYIPESIRNYPGAAGVAGMLERGGFRDVRVVPVLFGLMTIHVGRK